MPKIFLDMEEVLVDFRGGACQVHGVSREFADAECIRLGCWDLCQPLGITVEQFWKPITAAGEQFWLDLQPLPWFHQLLDLVLGNYEHWYIATSPSQCPTSYSGKAKWLHSKFGEEFSRWFPTHHKYELAGPGRVLIDDRASTIDKWKAHGGTGIVFPSCGNHLHAQAHDPVKYVKQQLGLT